MNNLSDDDLRLIEVEAQSIFISLSQDLTVADDVLIAKAWVEAVKRHYMRRINTPIANA